MCKDGPADSRGTADEPGVVEVENLGVGPLGSVIRRLHVKRGSLVVLQGPVKSFKTTVLKKIAGHVPLQQTESVRLGGTVSYLPQNPWMRQTTIQDNIISCEPFEEKRYNDVLRACGLVNDLANMRLGDQTPVAEKGLNLVGSQRQRVALARAAYRRADVYLLDNPIYALEDSMQQFIWVNLVEGFLSDATVIVASSRAIGTCTYLVHLSSSGVEGDTVDVSGYVIKQEPSPPLPLRYRSAILSGGSSSTTQTDSKSATSEHCPPIKGRSRSSSYTVSKLVQGVRKSFVSLESAATGDVSAEADLFEKYASASHSTSTLRATGGDEAYGMETRFIPAKSSGSSSRHSFISFTEQQREINGDMPATKVIGSRRISFYPDFSSDIDSTYNTNIKDESPSESVNSKSPFVFWMQNSKLRTPLLAAFASLYLVYPAPRLWFEQWIGFWSVKKYSQDNQFSLNILGVTFMVLVIVRLTMDFSAHFIAFLSERNMRRAFCSTITQAPLSFFMAENLGPLVSLFSKDLSSMGEQLMQDFHAGVYYMAYNFAVSVFVCTSFPQFIPLAFVVYLLIFFLQVRYSQKLICIRKEFQQSQDDVFCTLNDCLEGIEVLRSAEAEQWAINLLSESLRSNRVANIAVERTNMWLARRADFLAVCLCFSTVMFVNYYEMPNPAARGLIISTSMPILVLFNWSMKLLGNVHVLLSSVHRIQHYIEKVHMENKSGSVLPKEFPATGALKFQDICLRYSPSMPLALDRVSFNLAAGAKVGIVGPTGSGKSSILVALFRLIQTSHGSIIVDGISAADVGVDAFRRQIAIIPQTPALFEGTLRMNLDPFDEFTDPQVRPF